MKSPPKLACLVTGLTQPLFTQKIHQNISWELKVTGPCITALQMRKKGIVYRQRLLENRGWVIERIWSRNWWRNPSAEIERIDQKVKELLKSELVLEKVLNYEGRRDRYFDSVYNCTKCLSLRLMYFF